MDIVFYLKDTGYKTTDLSGTKSSWLVNHGEPIRIHITDINIVSQANLVTQAVAQDVYYNPEVVSKNLVQVTITCYFISDFAVNGSIYIYNKENDNYEQIDNPPVASIVALLEQATGKNSHFDLYMSDGSGVTPDYFKQTPLYWLAKVKSNTSDTITPERHLNLFIKSYTTKKASNKRYDVVISGVVLE